MNSFLNNAAVAALNAGLILAFASTTSPTAANVNQLSMATDDRDTIPLQAADMLAGQTLAGLRKRGPELKFHRPMTVIDCVPPNAGALTDVLKMADDLWSTRKD